MFYSLDCDAMDEHSQVIAVVGDHRCELHVRLGPLHPAHKHTNVHERCAALGHQSSESPQYHSHMYGEEIHSFCTPSSFIFDQSLLKKI